jgi:CHAT domain-containing protein
MSLYKLSKSIIYILIAFTSINIAAFSANVTKETYDTERRLTNLYNESKFHESLALAMKLAELYEKQLGPCAATGNAYITIGNIYGRLGDLDNFLKYKEKNLQIIKKEYGPKSLNYAYALDSMCEAYFYVGDYVQATDCINKSYEIIKKLYGENHWETAATLAQIGVMLSTFGNKEKALEFYEQSYHILWRERDSRKIPGNILMQDGINDKICDEQSITQRIIGVLQSLSNCNLAIGKNDEALLWANKCSEYINTLSLPNKDEKSRVFTILASCLSAHGSYNEAEIILQKNLSLWESAEDEFLHKAEALGNLGDLYFDQQKYKEALAYFDQAMALYKKAKYGDREDVFYSYQRSLCHRMLDNPKEAEEITRRSVREVNKTLDNVLGLSEKERLGWQSLNSDFSCILATLQPHEAHQCIVRRKGVVLDSLMEDRAVGSNPQGIKIIQTLQNLKSQLAATESAGEPDSRRVRDTLEGAIAGNERKLAEIFTKHGAARHSAQITLEQISSKMPEDATLLDFVKYKNAYPPFDWQYGAFVMPKNSNSMFISIGNATEIDSKISALNRCIVVGDELAFNQILANVSELVWQPLASKIKPNQNKIIICPDGSLNFLSFACLLNKDNTFLSEKFRFSYISSARDLAKKPADKISKSIAIFANPQFDGGAKSLKTSAMVAMRSNEADVFGSIALPPLPGTETEAQSLGSLAMESGWNAKSALGKNATESSVRSTKNPGVLHLATHGFYLNSYTPPGPEGSRGMSVVGIKGTAEEKKKNQKGVDPMRASGVALTGAQNTLSSWSQRKAPDPETDGVLTAEEVGALRLDGTWMVVLSACETGVGEARSGEGVFGLRRAFMIAGAENLLMTLWPVADETTAQIMADFYKEAFATGDAAGSLAKVQRDWLVKIRQERGLLAAIREAGPFAMVTMTAPSGTREFVEGKIEMESVAKPSSRSEKILSFEAALAKANAGNAYAQAIVSIYYGLGFECEQDDSKSKEYVMLSAKQQNPLGIYRLAEMREAGQGMDQNTEQAEQLMQKAKSGLQKLSGDPYAMTALATIYERENPASTKARDLLTKAAEMGYEPAQTKLYQANQ